VRRLLAIAAVLLGSLGVTAPVPGSPLHGGCAGASSLHHAALIVEHGDGSVVRRCVGFDGASITGEQLLDQSGVEWAGPDYGGMGREVCQIDEEPSAYDDPCLQSGKPYWAMFVSRGGGAWTGSNLGISAQAFADGDAEGFRFGVDPGAPVSPVGTCGDAVPAATAAAPAVAPAPATSARTPSGNTAAATATAATATPPAASHASATAAAGVLGVGSAPLRAAPAAEPVGSGVIVAALVAGALAGLLVLQVLLTRRRRSAPAP
jgi:hypothetical protein